MQNRLWLLAPALIAIACSDAVRGHARADAGAGAGGMGGAAGTGGSAQDGGAGTAGAAAGAGAGAKCGCASASCQPVRIASVSSTIAVDAGYVYAIDTEGQDEVVKYAKHQDATRVPLAPTTYPYPFVIDDANVYFVADDVSKVAKTGGSAISLTTSIAINGTGGIALGGAQIAFQGGSGNLYAVAIDAQTAAGPLESSGTRILKLVAASETSVYFSLFESFATPTGPAKEIFTLPLSGGTRTQIASGADITGLRYENGALYWLDRGAAIRRLDDGTTASKELIVGEAQKLDGQHFAVDATHAYWASSADGSIYRVPIESGTAEPIALGRAFDSELGQDAIALDTDCVFFSDSSGIFMVPK